MDKPLLSIKYSLLHGNWLYKQKQICIKILPIFNFKVSNPLNPKIYSTPTTN